MENNPESSQIREDTSTKSENPSSSTEDNSFPKILDNIDQYVINNENVPVRISNNYNRTTIKRTACK